MIAITDRAHRDKHRLYMALLDWEKAFDKIDQDMLLNALWRLNLPEEILWAIASFYDNPQFRIRDREGTSEYRTQKAGIRQGCPLSPYLFILLMTVMFYDIYDRVGKKI